MPSNAPREDSSAPADRRQPPKEEPDFVNEADIPTEGERPARSRADPKPGRGGSPQADVAGVESAAGEEDPGAALDTPPTPRSPA